MSSGFFPSTGQTLTSTALTQPQMQAIFVQTTANVLGLAMNLALTAATTASSQVITVANPGSLAVGFQVSGPGIPVAPTPPGVQPIAVTITAISGTSVTLSLPATATASAATLLFTNPVANTAVRTVWQQTGAPAWGITDDVAFVRCVEESSAFADFQRDQGITQTGQAVTLTREYTRVWSVSWDAYGPNAFDNLRLLKSALLLEVTSEPLSASNLYVETDVPLTHYVPELQDGQWWARATFTAKFYEQVTETIVNATDASLQIILVPPVGPEINIPVT